MANPPRRHDALIRLCRALAVLALVPHDAAAHLAARRTEDRELVELTLNLNWNLKSVATLMLVQQGKLALTDEVKKLVPDIPIDNPWQSTDPVRIAHLLENTAGFDDWSMKAYAYNNPTISLREGFAIDAQSRRSRWRPGTFMAYTNAGPPVVARIMPTAMIRQAAALTRRCTIRPAQMASRVLVSPPRSTAHPQRWPVYPRTVARSASARTFSAMVNGNVPCPPNSIR